MRARPRYFWLFGSTLSATILVLLGVLAGMFASAVTLDVSEPSVSSGLPTLSDTLAARTSLLAVRPFALVAGIHLWAAWMTHKVSVSPRARWWLVGGASLLGIGVTSAFFAWSWLTAAMAALLLVSLVAVGIGYGIAHLVTVRSGSAGVRSSVVR